MFAYVPPNSIYVSIAYLALGFFFLIKGGDMLVDGAVEVARKFGLPMAFIGLTIVAFGTSAPELFTTVYAGMQGRYDMATANVLGSNIFNICFVVGIVGFLFPFTVRKKTFQWDWAWLFATSLLLLLFVWDREIKSYEGIILFSVYLLFITFTLFFLKKNKDPHQETPPPLNLKILIDFFWVSFGLIGLVVGSKLALDGGVQIGKEFGLSDRFIGLIILSIGTSLPELMTSIVAAYKGYREIAIANVIGSNLANSLVVLGLASAYRSFKISDNIINPDLFFVLGFTFLLGLLIFITQYSFKRWQGLILLSGYALYFYGFVWNI